MFVKIWSYTLIVIIIFFIRRSDFEAEAGRSYFFYLFIVFVRLAHDNVLKVFLKNWNVLQLSSNQKTSLLMVKPRSKVFGLNLLLDYSFSFILHLLMPLTINKKKKKKCAKRRRSWLTLGLFIYMCIYITHRFISVDSHWIKRITWYKIGRWLWRISAVRCDIRCLILFRRKKDQEKSKRSS